jgi:hypothetical protein
MPPTASPCSNFATSATDEFVRAQRYWLVMAGLVPAIHVFGVDEQ